MEKAPMKDRIIYYKNKYGLVATLKKGIDKIFYKINYILFNKQMENEYYKWIYLYEPKRKQLRKQRKTKFKMQPKISLIVPMYHTPEKYFKELVKSLLKQTYTNWELCLADGSEKQNKKILKIIKKDRRIKYQFLTKNLGISGNTNEALKLATRRLYCSFRP